MKMGFFDNLLGSNANTPSAPGVGARGLPAGWTEEVDPSSGDVYFYNAATGETKWDRPAAPQSASAPPAVPSTAVVAAAKPVIPSVAGIAKLPRGWRMITDADGKQYYFNKKSARPPTPLCSDACSRAPHPVRSQRGLVDAAASRRRG